MLRGELRAHRNRDERIVYRHIRCLVVHNGKVTEEGLLGKLKKDLNNGVLTICFQKGDVNALIKKAKELILRSTEDPYDRVFIISDIDNTNSAKLLEYCENARREGLALILSNPCIEVWASCYSGKVSGESATIAGAQKEAEDNGVVTKKIVNEKLLTDHLLAMRVAKGLRRQFGDNILVDSPTTDMYQIVDCLKDELKDR